MDAGSRMSVCAPPSLSFRYPANSPSQYAKWYDVRSSDRLSRMLSSSNASSRYASSLSGELSAANASENVSLDRDTSMRTSSGMHLLNENSDPMIPHDGKNNGATGGDRTPGLRFTKPPLYR